MSQAGSNKPETAGNRPRKLDIDERWLKSFLSDIRNAHKCDDPPDCEKYAMRVDSYCGEFDGAEEKAGDDEGGETTARRRR